MRVGKVCNNINDSDIKIVKSGLIFYFSSDSYKRKFEQNVDEYVKNEVIKLENKNQVIANFELYFLIGYYKRLEKRGFKVYDDVNKKYLSNNLVLTNQILIY